MPSSTGYLGSYPSPQPPMPTGGASDLIFWENGQTITSNYTITTGQNAGTFGPITINSGVTVTVPSGSTWSVI
jgi:hypothetical protein